MANTALQSRWFWLLLATLAISVWLARTIEIRQEARETRPLGDVADIEALRDRQDLNLLFILIDTLRSDHLGSYGYHRNTSPRIDRLAEAGIRFARHLAQSSWTKCSMASLWTGLHPPRSGVTRFDHLLSDEAEMPAEVLSEAGFTSIGLYRNGWVSDYFGFAQGFEVYEKPLSAPLPRGVRRANPTVSIRGTDIDTVDMAMEFLRLRGGERWFMYTHFMDVHEFVYDEDTALFGTSNLDIYDNSIRREDKVIELFLDRLEAGGHLDDTVVVIAADHGEAFGERGLEGHARAVYRETTEVPFIIQLPFKLEPGVTITHPTENVDIWPTLFDLLGLPAWEDVDGRSRLPEILAAASGDSIDQPEQEKPHFAFLDQRWGKPASAPMPSVSIIHGPYRYVRGEDGRGRPVEELFDMESDEAQLANLLLPEMEPKIESERERFRASAQTHLAQKPKWSDAPNVELDEMQLNQLRALGYSLP